MGEDMKRIKKFLAWVLLTTTLTVNLTGAYCVPVEAAADAGKVVIDAILSEFGICAGEDLYHSKAGTGLSEELQKVYDDLIRRNLITVTESGNIVATEQAGEEVVAAFDTYVKEHPEITDVLWFPTIASDQVPASWFRNLDLYNLFRTLTDTTNYSMYLPAREYDYVFQTDTSDLVVTASEAGSFPAGFVEFNTYITTNWGNDTQTAGKYKAYFYQTNGEKKTVALWYKHYLDSSLDTGSDVGTQNSDIMWNSYYYGGYAHIVRGCNTDAAFYFPCFSNINAYKNWLTGGGSYYRFDSGYQGGDITINPNADYSTITDAIKNALQQSIRAGQSVTNALSAMQKAFREELAKISGTIGDIEDNTEQTNSWLEKIYNLLQQIYDLMQTQHDELTAYFESANTAMEELPAKMAEAFQGFYDGLTELLHQARDDIVASTDQIGENTKETNTWLEKIHDLIQKLQDILQKMSEFLQKQYDDLTAYFKSAKEAAAELPAKMADAFRGFFKDIIDEIKRARDDIVDTVKDIDFSGSVDETPDENGDTVWTKLGRGLAKILTAVLNLLKLIIFKGLDALDYLIGLLNENVDAVFLNIESYFERVNLLLPESDSAPVILTGVLPKEIRDVMVVCVFMIFVGIVVQQVRK